jgi:hypothetical protein
LLLLVCLYCDVQLADLTPKSVRYELESTLGHPRDGLIGLKKEIVATISEVMAANEAEVSGQSG